MPTIRTRTVKASGGDYSTLAAWEAGEQADLVAADEIRQAECYAFVDATSQCYVSGWTTDAMRYIRIYTPTAERHAGKPNTGFRLQATTFDTVLNIQEDNVTVEGVSFNRSLTGTQAGIISDTAAPAISITECYFDWTTGSTFYPIGIPPTMTSGTLKIKNCVFHLGAYPQVIDLNHAGGTVYLYNCTALHTASSNGGFFIYMMRNNGGVAVAKNCIGDSPNLTSASAFTGTWTSSTNNCTRDNTAPGTFPRHYRAPAFVDAANGDYRISASDTAARDQGADLSADAVIPFSDDILGKARPAGFWDIGASEYVPPTFYAKRTRPHYGKQKPPVGYEIDWSHPLTRGLKACFLFNEGAGRIRDLVTGKQFAQTGGSTYTMRYGRAGLGLVSPVDEYGRYVAASLNAAVTVPYPNIIAIVDLTSTTISSADMRIAMRTDPYIPPYNGWGLYLGTDYTFKWWAGDIPGNRVGTNSIGPSQGPIFIAGVCTPSTIEVWMNGRKEGSTANTDPPVYDGATLENFVIGGLENLAYNQSYPGTIYALYVYDRPVNHLALYREPYAFLHARRLVAMKTPAPAVTTKVVGGRRKMGWGR
jgi:hypothetical protein